jgi:hypothetical protein
MATKSILSGALYQAQIGIKQNNAAAAQAVGLKKLDKTCLPPHLLGMGLPDQPVTLTPAQVAELNRQLSTMRHNVNNHLALISASGEILQIRPEAVAKVTANLIERPLEITREVRQFSDEFERVLGISQD